MLSKDFFYPIWLNTKNKAMSMLLSHAYFPKDFNQQHYNSAMVFIYHSFHSVFHKSIKNMESINRYEIEPFINDIDNGIKDIHDELYNRYNSEPWIDFPISTLTNLPSYLTEYIHLIAIKKSTLRKHFDKFNSLKDFLIGWIPQISLNHKSENVYKELTEVIINQMIEEFKLSSLQIMDRDSWQQNFINIQDTYNSIKESHLKIGLPIRNLGANEKLNLVISKNFLNEKDWVGFSSKTATSFSIFISPQNSDTSKIWIHEYTHFLDRLAAYVYYQSKNNEQELSSFSHIALDYVTNQKPIHNKSLKIMAEAMAATIGGVKSEEFADKITNSIKLTKENITFKILTETLPNKEKSWESLDPTERQILLSKTKISELTNFIMLEVSNHPNASFNLNEDDTIIAIEGHNHTNSNLFVPDLIQSIHDRLPSLDVFLMHSNLLEYIKEDLPKDVSEIMTKNNLFIYKDHSIYNDRFFISPGNNITKQAQQAQTDELNATFSYYDKPLELLARMSESLQNPILNNYEYKRLEIKEKNDFINPILGKYERMMVCATLQGLAAYVGIEVPLNDLSQLPCVIPQKIEDTLNLRTNDMADFKYATPNHLIPSEEKCKEILIGIEKNRTILLQTQALVNKTFSESPRTKEKNFNLSRKT
jgi:hypothetical protein